MNSVARDIISLYLLSFFSYFLLFVWMNKTKPRNKVGYLIFLATCWLLFAMPLLWNNFLRNLMASGVQGKVVTCLVASFIVVLAIVAFINHSRNYKNVSVAFKRNVYCSFGVAVIVINFMPAYFNELLFYLLQVLFIVFTVAVLIVMHRQKIKVSHVTDFYILSSIFLVVMMYIFKSILTIELMFTVLCGCIILLFVAFLIFHMELSHAKICCRDDKIKAAEIERYYLSNYDEMTRLKNKNALQVDLEKLLLGAQGAWLLLISISNIANIKTYLGHARANEIVCEIAEIIVDISLSPESLYFYESGSFITVSSISEKEFELGCAQLNRRISEILHSKIKLKVMVEFAATYLNDQNDSEQLLKELHLALLQKNSTSSIPSYFNPSYQVDFENDIKIQTMIEDSIAQENIVVWYQPKIELVGEKIVGFEALVRIPDVNGFIMPGDFIPVAEKSELIVELGYLIIQEVFSFVRRNSIQQIISINLAARQILDKRFFINLDVLLKKNRLKPSQIIFEITETSLMEDFTEGLKVIHHLREAGFGISIDDFGTGYSSFSYLADIPITEIKLDRSLLMGFETDMKKRSLIRSITQVADALDVDLVVEGIETQQQLELLRSIGCRWGQGYYFYRPLPEGKVLDLLKEVIHVHGEESLEHNMIGLM